MSPQIDIQIDPAQLQRLEQSLATIPYGLQRVVSRAINKVAVTARTRLLRMIVEDLMLKQKDIRDRNIKLRRASFDRLFAVLSVLGSRIPLRYFSPRQRPAGVTYQIHRGGGRKLIEHGFLQVMPKTGHEGVFLRTGPTHPSRRGPAREVRPRLPIYEPRGPSIPMAVANIREFADGTFQDLIGEKLAGELDMQVQVLLDQMAKEAPSAVPF